MMVSNTMQLCEPSSTVVSVWPQSEGSAAASGAVVHRNLSSHRVWQVEVYPPCFKFSSIKQHVLEGQGVIEAGPHS